MTCEAPESRKAPTPEQDRSPSAAHDGISRSEEDTPASPEGRTAGAGSGGRPDGASRSNEEADSETPRDPRQVRVYSGGPFVGPRPRGEEMEDTSGRKQGCVLGEGRLVAGPSTRRAYTTVELKSNFRLLKSLSLTSAMQSNESIACIEQTDGPSIEASAVLLTTEAHATARLLEGLDDDLPGLLRSIPYASSAIVNIAYSNTLLCTSTPTRCVLLATGANRIYASGLAQSRWTRLGAAHGRAVDGGQRARRTGGQSAARLPDLGEGRGLLWLALQLLGTDMWTTGFRRTRPRSPRPSRRTTPLGDTPPRWASAGCRRGRCRVSGRHGDRAARLLEPQHAQRLQGHFRTVRKRPPGRTAPRHPHGIPRHRTNGGSYGRPVGVTLGPDGSLLVADDVGDVIWRVTGA